MKTQPVGSAQWVQDERDQAKQFVGQEAEEFSFTVRNELEWLNEHVAEIFSTNQMCVSSLSLLLSLVYANKHVGILPMYSKHQASYVSTHRGPHAKEMP